MNKKTTQLNIRIIDGSRPDPDLIRFAAEILRRKGIVVAPTETRYGLLGSIDDEEVLSKLFSIKKRGIGLPTAIFVRVNSYIKKFGHENEISRALAMRFLPGPLTIVLRAKVSYPAPIVVDGKIGFRVSSSPVISGIMEKLDFCVTATSANISGDNSSTINDISSQLGIPVDLYLDAGPLAGKSSTVVDCSEDKYRILREGAISGSDISESLAGIS